MLDILESLIVVLQGDDYTKTRMAICVWIVNLSDQKQYQDKMKISMS